MSYLGTKNPILVDRRIYAFKGKWHKPRNDIETNIYYFVSTQMTLVEDYENGRERLAQQLEITIFGEHPIIKGDLITLDNGQQMKVFGVSYNYVEHNIAVRDMLKPTIASMVLTLR